MKQKIYLIRHAETEWTVLDKHTGLTDIPLTARGEEQAKALKERLKGHSFARVLVSPLQRAFKTCTLAGFSDKAEVDPDLVEWNYGDYEGKKTADILKTDPTWDIFSSGAPGGESVAAVGQRAKRVLKKIQQIQGDVALFSSGHFLRTLTACYLQLTPAEGRLFLLSPASISILGYEREDPVLLLWNSHL